VKPTRKHQTNITVTGEDLNALIQESMTANAKLLAYMKEQNVPRDQRRFIMEKVRKFDYEVINTRGVKKW
jgi:hypothetical protein